VAKKIQAWGTYGPKLELAQPMTSEELTEAVVAATNQSRGSVYAVLLELDVQLEAALKSGRIVQFPNGTHFRPTGHRDGSVRVNVRVNPNLVKRIAANFRGKWRNAQNIGKSDAEIFAIWNQDHPNDPVES
jgi:hypothetical protein